MTANRYIDSHYLTCASLVQTRERVQDTKKIRNYLNEEITSLDAKIGNLTSAIQEREARIQQYALHSKYSEDKTFAKCSELLNETKIPHKIQDAPINPNESDNLKQYYTIQLQQQNDLMKRLDTLLSQLQIKEHELNKMKNRQIIMRDKESTLSLRENRSSHQHFMQDVNQKMKKVEYLCSKLASNKLRTPKSVDVKLTAHEKEISTINKLKAEITEHLNSPLPLRTKPPDISVSSSRTPPIALRSAREERADEKLNVSFMKWKQKIDNDSSTSCDEIYYASHLNVSQRTSTQKSTDCEKNSLESLIEEDGSGNLVHHDSQTLDHYGENDQALINDMVCQDQDTLRKKQLQFLEQYSHSKPVV